MDFSVNWCRSTFSFGTSICNRRISGRYKYYFEIIVLHQFIVTNGLIGVLGFYINVIKADDTAKSLGWPGGPFQIKYGFSQLGLGVMGVLSIWFKGPFWLGTLITMYIYGASGLWTHTQEMMKKGQI